MNYREVIRELVPDYRKHGLQHMPISYAQLSVILGHHDHIQVEAAVQVEESVRATLADNSSFAGMHDSRQEAIGFLVYAAFMNLARRAIRLDLETTSADMQDEERQDREYERGAA